MSDERVERAATALAEWSKLNVVWDDPILEMAKVAVAALDEEPTLEDVLREAGAYSVVCNHKGSGGWDALVCGYVVSVAIRPTISEAIREAGKRAKEAGPRVDVGGSEISPFRDIVDDDDA